MITARPVSTARLGLGLTVVESAGGHVEFSAGRDHGLRLHASEPVGGFCGTQRFLYTPGDIDLLPAGESDEWPQDGPSRSLVLSLSPRLLERAADELGLPSAGLARRHQFRDPQIEHIAAALDAERRTGGLNGALYAESLGLALSVHLLGRYRDQARPQRGLSPLQRRRVAEYIEAHLDRDLRLTKLADLAGLRGTQFKALFRGSFGVTVHAYVMQRRVERAKSLLLRGELSAGQVALDAGFSHQSHMARCMRRLLGVTPSLLRRDE